MKIFVAALLLSGLLATACGPKDKELAAIQQLQEELAENREQAKTGKASLDSMKILTLSRKQEAWAHGHPKDTLAPVLLMRAGQNALLLGDGRRAYTLHAELLKQYPVHRLAEEALYQMASIAHVELGEAEEAQRLYKAYLSQHPRGRHARVAREAIVFFESLPDSSDARLKEIIRKHTTEGSRQ
ncbi:MAG: hypothetical protein KF690_05955 [Bacteroidetes bacterium]|nr:hypothetical protein [Bacteroidota bacterium]